VEGGRSGEFRKKRTDYFYRISTLHIDNSSHKNNKYDLKYFYAPHNINSSDQEETTKNPKIPISESEALEIIRGFVSI
jgi:hypothetical protein